MGASQLLGLGKGALHAAGHAPAVALRGRVAPLDLPEPGRQIPGLVAVDHGDAEVLGALVASLAAAQILRQRLDVGVHVVARDVPAFGLEPLDADACAGAAAHVHEQPCPGRGLAWRLGGAVCRKDGVRHRFRSFPAFLPKAPRRGAGLSKARP